MLSALKLRTTTTNNENPTALSQEISTKIFIIKTCLKKTKVFIKQKIKNNDMTSK